MVCSAHSIFYRGIQIPKFESFGPHTRGKIRHTFGWDSIFGNKNKNREWFPTFSQTILALQSTRFPYWRQWRGPRKTLPIPWSWPWHDRTPRDHQDLVCHRAGRPLKSATNFSFVIFPRGSSNESLCVDPSSHDCSKLNLMGIWVACESGHGSRCMVPSWNFSGKT